MSKHKHKKKKKAYVPVPGPQGATGAQGIAGPADEDLKKWVKYLVIQEAWREAREPMVPINQDYYFTLKERLNGTLKRLGIDD